MPPKSKPAVDLAVTMVREPTRAPFGPYSEVTGTSNRPAQVANGVDAREAWWTQCGKPNGEAGIQNIRKRGMAARRDIKEAAARASGSPEEAAAEGGEAGPTASQPEPPPNGKGNPRKGFRKVTSINTEKRSKYGARSMARLPTSRCTMRSTTRTPRTSWPPRATRAPRRLRSTRGRS